MQLIDTHAHIYLEEFDKDREEIIRHATERGISDIIMPAIDSSTHEKMISVHARFPHCLMMMGLHPCSVKENYLEELDIVSNYLDKHKFYAIGEIGMDLYWDKTFADKQLDAFHKQIKLALDHDLPIVIHSRNAIDECITVVKQYPNLKGVFHCFSGNEEQAKEVLGTSFYLGIGGVVTFKNSGLDKVISKIGLDRVILETDAPYLAPVPYRGKRNEPGYTRLVAEKLSDLLTIPLEEVAELTTKNVYNLFNLGSKD